MTTDILTRNFRYPGIFAVFAAVLARHLPLSVTVTRALGAKVLGAKVLGAKRFGIPVARP